MGKKRDRKSERHIDVIMVLIVFVLLVAGAINNIKRSDAIVEACHANVELQICE